MNPFDKVKSRISAVTLEQHLVTVLLDSLSKLYVEDSNNSSVPANSGYASAEHYVSTYLNLTYGKDNPAAKYVATMLA